MRIYVASSWRNDYQPMVVALLRGAGFDVYDFKYPSDTAGFGWEQISGAWQTWTNEQYLEALTHPLAEAGYRSDFDAMHWADRFVLVMPCGRSAHLEAGWAVGAGKPTAILLDPFVPAEPELMYKMADLVTDSSMGLLAWLGVED